MADINVVTIATDLGWTEGPVVSINGGIALVSISHGVVYRIRDGKIVNRHVTAGCPNGLTEDADGRLFVAQNGRGWPGPPLQGITGGVQVIEPDGAVKWVTQDPITPNDLCFGADGMLYVTDPTRDGLMDDSRLWRVNPRTGDAAILASLPWYANGIGFDAQDGLLVADTGGHRIVRLRLTEKRAVDPETFVETAGLPDGFAWDAEGNLIVCVVGATATDAGRVEIFSPAGDLVDTIFPGKNRRYTNVALDDAGTMYITDLDGEALLSATGWRAGALPLYPFRST